MNNMLPTPYQNFIALSRYARWLPAEGRRETRSETVDRYVDNVVARRIDDEAVVEELREAILSLSMMGSMRMMMTGATLALTYSSLQAGDRSILDFFQSTSENGA